jgi:glycosyltransferase involved in cell wall biosynthesis
MRAYSFCYNEADIIEQCIDHIMAQGLDCWVLDGHSTDGTWEILMDLTYRYQQRLHIEHFPEQPTGHFDIIDILRHISALYAQQRPGWAILVDADEFFQAPGGMTVAQLFHSAEKRGYNAVRSTTVEFHPIDDAWHKGLGVIDHFQHFIWGKRNNVCCWNTTEPVDLANDLDVKFRGRSACEAPRLIQRHYPYRNQAQATTKVFRDRQPRLLPGDVKRGWCDYVTALKPGHNFIRSPEALMKWDARTSRDEIGRLAEAWR